ncbi:MAG TPA: recombinase family protein [Pseudomonadota bacterium]|nr:recombinase family protein [Pseudomonadota bacterium]
MYSHSIRNGKNRSYKVVNSNTNHKIRVFGYCRVSTDMQVQHGLSLDAQREEIKRAAADRGWLVDEVFVDGGFSAKNTDRPAFQRMMRRR